MYKKYIFETTTPIGRTDKWCIQCDKYIYRNKNNHKVYHFKYPNDWSYFIPIHLECCDNFIKTLK